MRAEFITSAQNPKIKELVALGQKSSLRRESGIMVVEGRRELAHCLRAGFTARTIFHCPELFGKCPDEGDCSVIMSQPDALYVEIPAELYAKVACRESTEGVIAEVYQRSLSLDGLQLSERPLVAVLEGVEKPGNLGAVLRTVDACGADALIVCDPLTDIYNPNIIRASLGAVFTRQIAVCTSEEAIAFLKGRGLRILTAQLQDSQLYYDSDMRGGTALVMGTEATGLSDLWRQAADAHIRIPMLGQLDSLNVSVSTAILLFEAVRQRRSL